MINPQSEEKRQIIYVWNYREWGGAQVYFMSLMKEAKKKYVVSALLPSDSEQKILQYLEALEIPYEFLPPSLTLNTTNSLSAKISNRITIFLSENRLVENILSRDDITNKIFHVDLGFWHSALTMLRLCVKTNIFITVHTRLPLCKGWRGLRWKIKGKILSRFSSLHLLTSNNDAKSGLKPYIGAKQYEHVEVAYSGIDPVEITRVTESSTTNYDVQKRYGLPQDTVILMTVGQFIERKGCWVLLESLKRLKAKGKNFAFVWLSTITPDPETMKRVDNYGLGDLFRMMDAEEIGETRECMLTLLSVADVFVLASLQEGLPIALVEAMALGLPCIATDVNAIPEAIEDRKNGMLVPPNDAIRLAEAIDKLLNNSRQRDALGAAAKKIAFEKFNEKATAERTLKLYNDVWQTLR